MKLFSTDIQEFYIVNTEKIKNERNRNAKTIVDITVKRMNFKIVLALL